MKTGKSKKTKTPTKEQIAWMLGIKTTERFCAKTTNRIRAARKEFSTETDYMRNQRRTSAAIMHQIVGQPLILP